MTSKRITKSTGNVYADLGIKNAEEHALKAELVHQIAAALKEEGLNQAEAARRLHIAQPDVSRMLHGHFASSRLNALCASSLPWGRTWKLSCAPPPLPERARRNSPYRHASQPFPNLRHPQRAIYQRLSPMPACGEPLSGWRRSTWGISGLSLRLPRPSACVIEAT